MWLRQTSSAKAQVEPNRFPPKLNLAFELFGQPGMPIDFGLFSADLLVKVFDFSPFSCLTLDMFALCLAIVH
jgi:hypothetical protein